MNAIKLNIIRIILLTLTALLCCVIFALSSDNADESNEKSDYIVSGILSDIESDSELLQLFIEKSVYIVRKSAHFIEYGALGFLLAAVCTAYRKSTGITYLISQLCGSIYAVSDEVHQYFVPGRSCQLSDILLDSCGVFTGICLLVLIVLLYRKIKHKKR